MGDEAGPTGNALVKGGLAVWLLCVTFAVLPLVLFLAIAEVFTAGSVAADALLSAETWENEAVFSPAVKGYASIFFFEYGVHVFVHVLACLVVGLYFLSRLTAQAACGPKVVLSLAFAALVSLAVVAVIRGDTAFSGYMIEPLSAILALTDAPLPAFAANGEAAAYLTLALLFPTTLGIFVVNLASGSFHALLFSPRLETEDKPAATISGLSKILHRDLVALSLVLVSSVITARAFFTLPAHFFVSPEHGAAKFYGQLAQSLSTGAGLLFSATLLATFAPGFVALMGLSDEASGPGAQATVLWSRLALNLGRVSKNLKAVWRPIIAMIAPALASPLMDLFAKLAG